MTPEAVLTLLAAYLWGAIPTAYLTGRYLRGIDIRDYGSGNVGATNLMEHVGSWTGLGLGVFDTVGKGTLVVVVAMLTDQSMAVQAGAGLAALAGHNWSPYIGLTGGRGISAIIGVMLGFLMWREILIGLFVIGFIGRLVAKETALWSLMVLLVLPLLTYLLGEPGELVWMTTGFALLVVLKRLTAHWERPRGEYPLARVAAYRLLWDRDVPRNVSWTARRPKGDGGSQASDVGH